MIITLAGRQGSGKTTVANMLAEKLGYARYSTGDFMREMAMERGMTILELNQFSETDGGKIDAILDDRQKKIGLEKDNFVIDGRLSWYFIPHSFKVYLTVDERVGAERIIKNSSNPLRQTTDIHANIDDAINSTRARRESESKRYLELYGINNHELSNFDCVIDTTNISADKVVEEILAFMREKGLIPSA